MRSYKLRGASNAMRNVLADFELRKKVRDEAAEKIDSSQREYILRQQLAAIKFDVTLSR